MNRQRQGITQSGVLIIVIASINMLLLLCTCMLMHNHLMPYFGVNVQPASSQFIMGILDRSNTHYISITAGEEPRFFLRSKEIKGGWIGVEKALNALDGDTPGRINIIINADEAVALGTTQRLIDLILTHGFTCAIAAQSATTSTP